MCLASGYNEVSGYMSWVHVQLSWSEMLRWVGSRVAAWQMT